MNNEDYVSYELAKKLKECGFAEPCDSYYIKDNAPDGTAWIVPTTDREDFNADSDCPFCKPLCSASTLAQAQKWQRDEKNIIVIAEPDWDSEDYCLSDYLTGEWYFTVWKDGDRVRCNFDPNAVEERIWMFEKYEQALSAGIYAALELIKEGE